MSQPQASSSEDDISLTWVFLCFVAYSAFAWAIGYVIADVGAETTGAFFAASETYQDALRTWLPWASLLMAWGIILWLFWEADRWHKTRERFRKFTVIQGGKRD